jgi:hypothetical protein
VGHTSAAIRNHVRRALGSMGCEVDELAIEAPLPAAVLDAPRGLYVLETGENPEPTLSLAQEIRGRYADAPLLVIAPDYRRALLFELLGGKALNHCIAKQGALAAGLPLIDETELIVTCNKLLTNDIFGLSKYVRVWGVEVSSATMAHAEDREVVLSDLDRFIRAVDCNSVIAQAVLMTADELLMNAIFNAPRGENGAPKYAHLNRHEKFKLDEREKVRVSYACDGRYIALSVSDNFGSLSRDVIFHYLRDSIEGRAATMESKDGGAGLGIHMLSHAVTQLVFNVQPGSRTEVIALFYVRNGPRAFREAGRSLNIFFTSGEHER